MKGADLLDPLARATGRGVRGDGANLRAPPAPSVATRDPLPAAKDCGRGDGAHVVELPDVEATDAGPDLGHAGDASRGHGCVETLELVPGCMCPIDEAANHRACAVRRTSQELFFKVSQEEPQQKQLHKSNI